MNIEKVVLDKFQNGFNFYGPKYMDFLLLLDDHIKVGNLDKEQISSTVIKIIKKNMIPDQPNYVHKYDQNDLWKVSDKVFEIFGICCEFLNFLYSMENYFSHMKNYNNPFEKYLNDCIKKRQMIKFKEVSSSNMCWIYKRFDIINKDIYADLFIFDKSDTDYIFEKNIKHGIRDAINNKFDISNENVKNCIKNDNEDGFKMIVLAGINIDKNHFETACQYGNINILKEILNLNFLKNDDLKISKYLPYLLDPRTNKYRYNYYNGKYQYDLSDDQIKISKSKIELLLDFDFILTKDDIIELTKNKVIIQDTFFPKNFLNDKKFKDELIAAFRNISKDGYGIKLHNIELIALLKKRAHLSDIKKCIKQNNIIPDIECFKIAYGQIDYFPTISFLAQEYNFEIDFDCLLTSLNVLKMPKRTYNQLQYICKNLSYKYEIAVKNATKNEGDKNAAENAAESDAENNAENDEENDAENDAENDE
jgi:hypothetical protein